MLRSISARETLKNCNDRAYLVDIRDEYLTLYKKFDIHNIIYLPFNELKNNIKALPKDKMLILADSAGIKSKEAVKILNNNGIKNTANLAGGMIDWERLGFPVKIDKKEMLTGSCMCQLKKRNRKK